MPVTKETKDIPRYPTEVKMPDGVVTEEEIEAAERHSAQREFDAALGLLQGMLDRVHDVQTRMRLLFDLVTCSTWLSLDEVKNNAIHELEQLPDPEVSRSFVVNAQASVFIESGRAQEALDLLRANLESEVMEREDFQWWKYEHLFLVGRSLTRLARCEEALRAFDAASAMFSEGKFETDMLLDRSNCLLALGRYEEAYVTANRVQNRGDKESVTLAMQFMADARMWQSRVAEALELYVAIQKRLPSRLVQEERIQTGIKKAMAYLEKSQPHGKPS